MRQPDPPPIQTVKLFLIMGLIEVKKAILAWSINCVTNNVSLGLTNENYWVDRNAGLTHSRKT